MTKEEDVEMCDFIHDGSTVNRPNNAQEIYLKELGSESPMLHDKKNPVIQSDLLR